MPTPADLPDNAAMLLGMGFRAMTDRFHELLAAEGYAPVRPAHGFAFRLLASPTATATAGGVTTTQLAAHLSVTKQAASKLVEELERWGYVARTPHPRDRRAQALVLTDQGRRYVAHADALWATVEREWAELAGADAVRQAKAAVGAYVARAAGGAAPPIRPVW